MTTCGAVIGRSPLHGAALVDVLQDDRLLVGLKPAAAGAHQLVLGRAGGGASLETWIDK